MTERKELDEILNIQTMSGTTIGELSSKDFCKWCLDKLNGMNAYEYEVINLSKFLNNWKQTTMNEETRVDTIMRLRRLNVL